MYSFENINVLGFSVETRKTLQKGKKKKKYDLGSRAYVIFQRCVSLVTFLVYFLSNINA